MGEFHPIGAGWATDAVTRSGGLLKPADASEARGEVESESVAGRGGERQLGSQASLK